MGPLAALFSAFGLSTAAGLNAYVPLLTVGVMARLGLLQLQAPFDLLTHPLVLLIIAALAVLDFIGDKVPAVDSTLHAVGLIISPIAGAILFVAANSSVGFVHPTLAAICGLLVAGLTHGARATIRPVATAATAGTANPVISLLEDITALVVSVLAIVVPIVAFLLIVVLLAVAFRFFRRARNTWRRA
jgi:hypothetical protein